MYSGNLYSPRPVNLGFMKRSPVRHAPRLSLGQGKPNFNWGSLGEVILAGSAGAGLLYASKVLPSPFDTIATVGGISLAGYAAYQFFGGGEPAAKSNEVEKGKSFGIASPIDFKAITGSFLEPIPGSVSSFNWFSDHYAAKALVTNPSVNPVTVTFQLIAKETPYWFYVIPFGQSDEYVADTRTINLPPGNTPIDFDAAAVKTSRWLSGKINLDLTLRKIRVAGGGPGDIENIAHTNVRLM